MGAVLITGHNADQRPGQDAARGLLFALALTLAASAGAAPISGDARHDTTLRQVRAVLDGLPECSEYLDREPSYMTPGPELPYMAVMRRLGIQRAAAWLRATVAEGSPTKLAVISLQFFRRYDGLGSVITSRSDLEKIEASGLPQTLRKLALAQARGTSIGIPTDVKHPMPGDGTIVTMGVEFAADAWMSGVLVNFANAVFVTNAPAPATIQGAAWRQDVAAVATALAGGGTGGPELDRALVAAAGNADGSSNDAIISMLVRAGANINGSALLPTSKIRTGTALTSAIEARAACNVTTLLRLGADPNLPNALGMTPLMLARQAGLDAAERALTAAGARR